MIFKVFKIFKDDSGTLRGILLSFLLLLGLSCFIIGVLVWIWG